MKHPRHPVKIVSGAEAEFADSVLCMPISVGEFFPDDIRTSCAHCGRPIHHRPHTPKRPEQLCPDYAFTPTEDPEDRTEARRA